MLQLRCVVCHLPFDFAHGETAVVLRHIAYGYDFVHARHESTALEWIFVDPEFDRPEFTHDSRRAYILDVAPPDSWTAVVPQPPELVVRGDRISFQPLGLWVLVEHRDGSRHVEGLVRDPEWESEPGGAEFPEGENGPRDAVGYARAPFNQTHCKSPTGNRSSMRAIAASGSRQLAMSRCWLSVDPQSSPLRSPREARRW
jgi:hypothetical protein